MTVQELINAAQQLSLTDQIRLASQLMQLVVQKIQPASSSEIPAAPADDPLVGLFSGSPELASQSQEALRQEVNSNSGFTWKES
ncbi:MAG: hypothetical protein ACFB0C_22010 [Leptolyngbyaceae cyanobacterium]